MSPRNATRPKLAANDRRGFALILVLVIISMAMAVSYSVMRTQGTQLLAGANSNYRAEARQAALAGLSIALRKMNEPDWAGVDTTLSANLGLAQSYEVSYTTGDSSLSAGDSDYDDLPYRVTISATGYSPASPNATTRAEYHLRAVVQLIPRNINSLAEPNHWAAMNQHTIYQWQVNDSIVEVPAHIEGSVHLEGQLHLCETYPPEAPTSSTQKPFDGLIDEVAIFNNAFSPTQIQAIYAAALSGTHSSAYAAMGPLAWWRFEEPFGALLAADSVGMTTGVYQGAKSAQPGAPIGSENFAARFDGEDDFVALGNPDITGSAMTLLAWFKADDFGWSDGRIISKAKGPNNKDHYWMLSTVDAGGPYRLQFFLKKGGKTSVLVASSGDLAPGVWVFAAAVYDGAAMRIYKDGLLVGSMAMSGAIDTNPSVPAYIGNNPTQPDESPRSRYLRDLTAMSVAGIADYRPFTGPIELNFDQQNALTLANLEDDLDVNIIDHTSVSWPLDQPTGVTSYQLYPGGKAYTIPILEKSLSDVSLGPDPATNPLGVFRRADTLTLGNNVSIQGTLIIDLRNLSILGSNVVLSPVTLRPLVGETATRQLPTAIVQASIDIHDTASGSLTGLAVAWNNFKLAKAGGAASFLVRGKLFMKELELYHREGIWQRTDAWWWDQLSSFYNDLLSGSVSVSPYFPQWLDAAYKLDPTPRITIGPDTQAGGTEPSYLWPDWSQPIYLPHPDDADPNQAPGLRWDLIRWEEGV